MGKRKLISSQKIVLVVHFGLSFQLNHFESIVIGRATNGKGNYAFMV